MTIYIIFLQQSIVIMYTYIWITDKDELYEVSIYIIFLQQTIGELQHVIQKKLDSASLQVLCDASKLQDMETNNLQYTLQNNTISLNVWGNLSKNPR